MFFTRINTMKSRHRAVILFKRLRFRLPESVRDTERATSIPKSSVHRQTKNQKLRIANLGHDFFETEEGLTFLKQLVVAVVLVFGLQSGVGSDTISLFFNLLKLTHYVGASPSSIRSLKKKMRSGIDAYGDSLMPLILKLCENKELHLGGDETVFGSEQFLILMELASGFIFTEALVNDRTELTWKKHTDKFLKFFKNIASFISDGGAVLLKLGKAHGSNGMDLFHFLQDMRCLFATKFNSKRRALISQLTKVREAKDIVETEGLMAEKKITDKLSMLDLGQKTYRECLFFISTQVHPFKNVGELKSSDELKLQLNEQVEKLEQVKVACDIDDKGGLINRMKKRIEPISTLNDLWSLWVDTSLKSKTNDESLAEWAANVLLPYYYWSYQLKKSNRKQRLRLYYQQVVAMAAARLHADPLTPARLSTHWIRWAQAMAAKYQRTTSAIEGRNARLSQHYFATRGVNKDHVNSLTVLHNFWIKRDDGTSAANRLCGVDPPDFFEWLLGYMQDIPLPRKTIQINAPACNEPLAA